MGISTHTQKMPGMSGHTHLNMTINLKPLRNLIYMQKIEIKAQLVHEKSKIYYFGTLWACLGMFVQCPTQNKNFPKYGIYASKQVLIRLFNLYHFQKKIMIIFLRNIQKPCFGPIFALFWAFSPKLEFSQKIRLCHF